MIACHFITQFNGGRGPTRQNSLSIVARLVSDREVKISFYRGADSLYIPNGRKEGKVLLNDALNTFNLLLYGRQTYGKGPLR